MDLRWIEDFLALAGTRNFTRAAAERFTTQSAFSRRIKSLEDWAGAPLFERKLQPVTLTRAGESFLPRARELQRRLIDARDTIRREAAGERGTVLFAATHTLSKHFFPRWLRTVEPSATTPVRLFSLDVAACLERLAARHCHLALCHAQGGLPPELDPLLYQAEVVGRDRIVPVSAPDAQRRPKFHADAAADHPVRLLAYAPGSGLGRGIASLLDARAARVRVEFESSYADVLKAMAVEGYGLAFLPQEDVAAELADGRLVRAGDESWSLSLDIALVRAADALPPAAEAIWQVARAAA
jgi:LysR family transcriptional regulator, hypochlorite-specific transcription factor HypT